MSICCLPHTHSRSKCAHTHTLKETHVYTHKYTHELSWSNKPGQDDQVNVLLMHSMKRGLGVTSVSCPLEMEAQLLH